MRAETAGGKTYLVGRAASYNTLSHDLGGWREQIQPGAFDDALAARDLDVVHNVNHDPSKVLGRTRSGTLQLRSDSAGLNYRTLLPNVSYAADLAELCRRGDVSSSSFAFTVDPADQVWSDVDDPDTGLRIGLRTITRIASLHDVSTVTDPAYPGTAAELASRSLPEGMPIELRNRIQGTRAAADDQDPCDCDCPECLAGDCQDCSNEECDDENCRAAVRCAYNQMSLRCVSHGIQVDDEGDRAARTNRLQLAAME